jgi:thiamine transport system substrate-binding protein
MKRGIFSFLVASLASLAFTTSAHSADVADLRLLTHSAFAVPKPLLTQFEKDAGVKLRIVKAGDAGEMLNKLILTRAHPIADVVFGIDNALAPKALAAQVLDSYSGPAAKSASAAPLPAPLVPGNAFLLATIGALGEEKAFDWWARMRAGGMKVAKGWTEAYYTDFLHNGGRYPLVVSYATSPAAELFYAKDKPSEPPTSSLSLPGAVFRQVEGVALVKGGAHRVAAEKFIEFLRSPAVQQQMQTEMWMYPAVSGVARAEVMKFAPEPSAFYAPGTADIAAKSAQWVSRWTKVVLK